MKLTKAEFIELIECEEIGYCRTCKDLTNSESTIDPDNDSYECVTCGELTCDGLNVALNKRKLKIVKNEIESTFKGL